MVVRENGRAGWSVGCERVRSLSSYSCCCGRKRARRCRGLGGASAGEAGQSCSRHQGRHFLWGERSRQGDSKIR